VAKLGFELMRGLRHDNPSRPSAGDSARSVH